MALKRSLILFLMLILLLLALVWFGTSLCQETRAMRFQRQHMDLGTGPMGNHTYCNVMMVHRNMTRGFCKAKNTFIHEPLSSVQAICGDQSVPCKNRTMNNCYSSRYPMSTTLCVLRSRPRPPNCTYITHPTIKQLITVACDGTPLGPVHFEP
ncbi:ribonuclease pancreatic-like [Sorex fumeus]|uniref:ribonuclease pancreatic-like n=1 Tax=Sorex fumeus TaxID=62283 RepID=UPI0024ADD524|nr:ribonuclease pancreatic-like [Sorex fumeus]